MMNFTHFFFRQMSSQMQTGVSAWGSLLANWKEVDNAMTDRVMSVRAIDQNMFPLSHSTLAV